MAIQVIKDKFIREEILDENGKKIGELRFNPDDPTTYKKFTALTKDLIKGFKELEGIKSDLKAPEGELKTIQDFENASGFFDQLSKGIDISVEMFDEICKGFDEIFGEGTCEKFAKGSKDPELLMPLIEGTMPFFERARSGKTSKYLVENKKDDELQ